MECLKNIGYFLATHLMVLLTVIVFVIVSILSWFGVKAPDWLTNLTTTTTTSVVTTVPEATTTTIEATTTTTEEETTTEAPTQEKTVSVAEVIAAALTAQTGTATSTNKTGTVTTYQITDGVLLTDIIEQVFGVPMADIGSNAYLVVNTTDNRPATYDYALLSHPDSILAFDYTSTDSEHPGDPPAAPGDGYLPRLFPGGNETSSLFVRQVDSFVLYW